MRLCFVITGFCEKTGFAMDRKLDLNNPFRNIVKSAITAADYSCVRVDESAERVQAERLRRKIIMADPERLAMSDSSMSGASASSSAGYAQLEGIPGFKITEGCHESIFRSD